MLNNLRLCVGDKNGRKEGMLFLQKFEVECQEQRNHRHLIVHKKYSQQQESKRNRTNNGHKQAHCKQLNTKEM